MTNHSPESRGVEPRNPHELNFSAAGGMEISSLKGLLKDLNLPAEQLTQLNFLLSKAEGISSQGAISFPENFKAKDAQDLLGSTLKAISSKVSIFPNVFAEAGADGGAGWGLDMAVAQKVDAPEKVILENGTVKVLSVEEQAAFQEMVMQMSDLIAMWQRLQILQTAVQKLSTEAGDVVTALNLDEKTIANQITDIEAALSGLQRDYLNSILRGNFKIQGVENLDSKIVDQIVAKMPQALLAMMPAIEASAPVKMRASEAGHIRTELAVLNSMLLLAILLTACTTATEVPTVEAQEETPEQVTEDVPDIEPTIESTPVTVSTLVSPETEANRPGDIVFGSAASGELTKISTMEIEDFPNFATLEDFSAHVLNGFAEAWNGAGFSEDLINWENISIQSLQLNDKDEYEIFLQIPMQDGNVHSFMVVAANESEELIPIDSENLTYRFMMMADHYDEESNTYVIGIAANDGTVQKTVVEIDLETGDVVLKGIFAEEGQASLGNMIIPGGGIEMGKAGLMQMAEVPQLTLEAATALAQDGVVLRLSAEGKWQVYNQESETALWELRNGEWESAVEMFDVCSIENFRDVEVSQEQLLDGTYFNWLKNVVAPTLVPEFQERYLNGTMQTDVPFVLHSFGESTYISYDPKASFADEDTRPFMRNVTFAWHSNEWREPVAGAPESGYLVSSFFFYEVTNAETGEGIAHPVIAIQITNENIVGGLIEDYRSVREPIIYTSPTYEMGWDDPILLAVWNNFPDMDERMESFFKGDLGALSEPGIVVISTPLSGGPGWYED